MEIEVKTETGKKLLRLKVGKKESISRIFSFVFPHRENIHILKEEHFVLRTVYPIVDFHHNDQRTLKELNFKKKKTFNL